MASPNAIRGAIKAAGASPPVRAFHGSPHDFDRFDASKIGMGDGNASHGHGLYFSKSKDLAEYYRPPGGRVYEVEFKRPETEMLQWNTPVIQQGGNVQDAVRSLLDRDALQLKGGKAYDLISKHYGDNLSDDRASQLLREYGVFGNSFLGPRQKTPGRPTNYVIYPGGEDSIAILRKYGLLPAVGAGAAAQGNQQNNQQVLSGLLDGGR